MPLIPCGMEIGDKLYHRRREGPLLVRARIQSTRRWSAKRRRTGANDPPHSLSRERWGENRPPKGMGGPRFGSVDKGWCCHRLNDQRIILSTKLRLFPDHRGAED